MSTILRVDHRKLHRLMCAHFRIMSNQWHDRIASLDYGPGRKNCFIAEQVGIDVIEQALKDFYAKFAEFGC